MSEFKHLLNKQLILLIYGISHLFSNMFKLQISYNYGIKLNVLYAGAILSGWYTVHRACLKLCTLKQASCAMPFIAMSSKIINIITLIIVIKVVVIKTSKVKQAKEEKPTEREIFSQDLIWWSGRSNEQKRRIPELSTSYIKYFLINFGGSFLHIEHYEWFSTYFMCRRRPDSCFAL